MNGQLSESRSQAYLNEYKGNLFEYLVALELAKKFHLQSQFTQSLGPNQWNLLQHYEREVRKLQPQLSQSLPLLAEATAEAYATSLDTLSSSSISQIQLRGKTRAKGGKGRSDEGDLSLCIDGEPHLISLKLGRADSFVNTKSGGIKSFIAEYFSPFQSEWQQRELNQYLRDSHLRMGEELYHQRQLHFTGEWDEQWRESGQSELPGELSPTLRPIVYDHYRRVATKLYEILWSFYQRDARNFRLCLFPLLGFTRKLTQIKVYHRQHQLHSIAVLSREAILRLLNSMEWNLEDVKRGFFHIDFEQHRFQLRLKPMNKFTAEALKVNCSLKFQRQ